MYQEPTKIRYEFSLKAADRVVIYIDPHAGNTISNWSFNRVLLDEDYEAPYFAYHVHSMAEAPFEFWIEVEVCVKKQDYSKEHNITKHNFVFLESRRTNRSFISSGYRSSLPLSQPHVHGRVQRFLGFIPRLGLSNALGCFIRKLALLDTKLETDGINILPKMARLRNVHVSIVLIYYSLAFCILNNKASYTHVVVSVI